VRPVAIGIGVVGVVLLGGLTYWRMRHQPAPRVTRPPAPRPTPRAPKVVAHVGEVAITDQDVARHQGLQSLYLGVMSDRQALDDLIDRALLAQAASENDLKVEPAELQHEILRKKLVVGAMAGMMPRSPAGFGPGMPGGPGGPGMPGMPMAPGAPMAGPGAVGGYPPGPGMPGRFGHRPPSPGGFGMAGPADPGGAFGSPMDRVGRMLAEQGLSEDDLAKELQGELLAGKVKQKLVYDKIEISKHDLMEAYKAEPPRPMPPVPPPAPGKKPPAPAKKKDAPDEATLSRLRQRLRVTRGAEPLAKLMTELKDKWKVQLVQ
jgi:hypothetical protein